jgi:poly(A) polymerase
MPTRHIATSIVKKLSDAGHIAYFAGGWVRDFLMQYPSDDIDIATSASVEQIQSLFPKTIPVGVAFGIVIVVQENHQFEVATFRKERDYVDGRRPTHIEPTTPEEDALRRDFTINGMFFDPIHNKLLDYVGGQEDIRRGIIRAIGDPHQRFLEDRLRMMRAVRYSTRFGFPIDTDTEQAILSHAASLLPSVAMERIWQEFKKMSQFAHFDKGLATLHKLNLLPTIFPALKSIPLEEIQKRLSLIESFPKGSPPIAELLELFPADSLEFLLELCDYLKLSKAEKDFVRFFHYAKTMLNMPVEWLSRLELVEWAHFYAHPHCDLCLQIHAVHLPKEQQAGFLSSHTERKKILSTSIERIRSKNPIIKSEHLTQEGIQPGIRMGRLLREAERIAVNEQLEEKEQVLKKLKETKLWSEKI